jgi:hypothetical protein
MHVYEVRPRKDKRGADVISDRLPFGRLRYDKSENAVGYAKHGRAHSAVIRVYDDDGNVAETHEHRRRFPRVIIVSSKRGPRIFCTLYGARRFVIECRDEQETKKADNNHARRRNLLAWAPH